MLCFIGVPTVDSVSASGLTLTCASSGGPATIVTWRRNCAVLPNNAIYQQTQTVTQTQTATYQNTLMIDSAVTDQYREGVYTCSVTNARGYSNGNIGLGGNLKQVHVYALCEIFRSLKCNTVESQAISSPFYMQLYMKLSWSQLPLAIIL